MTLTRIPVRGPAPYDVVVGSGALQELPALVAPAQRVAVVHDAELVEDAASVAGLLDGHQVTRLALPGGEAAKRMSVAGECWEALGAAGFTRSDMVVTVGGGATTDVGGFVAATWLRGVPVVHVPTTVLGMVDAAVGGKTGINTGAGKNLVGAFHEPTGVLCDLDLLATLPPVEVAAGLGEVVKCGFIADPEILELVERDSADALDHRSSVLRELIERAVRVKAEVVSADLKETGGTEGHPGREVLNYGHTLAHAIERAQDYGIRHGAAVSIGCCYVAEVARLAGLLDDATAQRHAAVFGSVGLPTTYDATGFDDLLATMRVDKKSRGSTLRLVVLHGLADPRILAGPDEGVLRAAYRAIGGPR